MMPHLVHNGDTKVHNIHQVQKPGKSAPGGSYQRMWILSKSSFKASYKIFAESAESTRGKNPAKVPLVGEF
jgi:hypothetical protein